MAANNVYRFGSIDSGETGRAIDADPCQRPNSTAANAMHPPRVSIVIPTYNRAWTLAEAIDSVLGQTFASFEIIVVDDGSTDGTARLLQRYGSAVRVLRQINQGVSAARNAGIRSARGELIALLDSDDLWRPEKLARQVA
jgi:glycosyltransferase involved in cell wall biosynthesis